VTVVMVVPEDEQAFISMACMCRARAVHQHANTKIVQK